MGIYFDAGRSRPGFPVRAVFIAAAAFLGMTGTGHAAGCGRPVKAGVHPLTIQSGGVERQGLYYIPSRYTGTEKLAAVFDFHGSDSHPAGQFRRSGWDKAAEREGFVAVALQGSLAGKFAGTHAWNVPGVTKGGVLNDEMFIRDAVKAVKATLCVDPARIYASGYSGGGRMLSQYICNGHPEFAAAGFVMGLRAGTPREKDGVWHPDTTSCTPANPISIIAFSGMKDKTNPFVGGGKPYWQYGGETALARWAELDRCKGKSVIGDYTAMTSMSYETCEGGARITSYLLKDNGHGWPARSVLFRTFDAAGKAATETDATGRMWNFFKNTKLPQPAAETAQADCTAGKAQSIDAKNTKMPERGTECRPQKTRDRNAPMAGDAL
ncbi:alpha/beta hydrolase family esterase [Pararhizobium sp.]|uniref:alpha/beta hydrolase family esterase n=1 Tax=Pararhizobium sp. TaxID=1977563 RepID=UPI00271888EA|nr:polyhydroxybutyrate depolymerase [Pararhizobium sp.]MDO9415018.1 polyhydroxybutyrate depolymerase [Pararhizobium sp.]